MVRRASPGRPGPEATGLIPAGGAAGDIDRVIPEDLQGTAVEFDQPLRGPHGGRIGCGRRLRTRAGQELLGNLIQMVVRWSALDLG